MSFIFFIDLKKPLDVAIQRFIRGIFGTSQSVEVFFKRLTTHLTGEMDSNRLNSLIDDFIGTGDGN